MKYLILTFDSQVLLSCMAVLLSCMAVVNACSCFQWDLVCDDAWQQTAAQTVFFAGRIAGAIFSLLSDR